MFLLDTMVISEGFKARLHLGVMSWLESAEDRQTFVSILSIGEISRGIRKLERQGEARAVAYRNWLEAVLADYDGCILPTPSGPCRYGNR